MTQPLSSHDIKQHLIEMMADVDAFCKTHGLRYFLAWGTLLGAIRHKGFIPWDDDIDIWMPRPDYNRFIKEFQHEYLCFRAPETDPEWPLNYGKVCDERYTAVDRFGNDFGIFIDIFPLEGMPDDPKEAQKHLRRVRRVESIWSNQLFTRKVPLLKKTPILLKIKSIFGKFLHLLIPFRVIRNKLDKEYTRYDFDQTHHTSSLSDSSLIFEKRTFLPAGQTLFEGYMFSVPNDFDLCLRLRYGNYMELPPEEDRYCHELTAYLKKN